MSIWGTLFSSGKTVEKVTDAVISSGDKLFYTEEEKAEDRMKMREYFPTLLRAYEPFKIAQRVLAIWFSLLFGIAFLAGLSISLFNIYIKYEWSKEPHTEGEALTQLSVEPIVSIVNTFDIGLIMLAIVSFYFGGGFMESFNRRGKNE